MKKIRVWIDFIFYPLSVLAAVLYGPRDLLWVSGLVISFFSAVLWLIARWQLGGSFSVDAEARQLMTHGLYAKIRHPIYVFGDLAYLGAMLALRQWLGYLIWLYVVYIDIRRARNEERLLAAEFGSAYLAYKQKTWF